MTRRRVAVERVALVLGGGGLKGLAHVGAWRALRELGVEVTSVVGTSIGALVGASVAAGVEPEHLSGLARAMKKTDIVMLNRWALLFNGIRQPSVFRDDTFRTYIASVLPVQSFDELALPLTINVVDLESGELVWFGAGGRDDVALADAVYASCALPVFYPPALIDGRYYVDGGLLDVLPIEYALGMGVDRVIAIDVSAGPVADSTEVVSKGLVAIHHRVMQIVGNANRRAELEAVVDDPRVVYVRPELGRYSTFDFTHTDYFLGEGYRATRAALTGEVDSSVREAVS